MPKPSPFRHFKTSPEIIRLTVMLYVRFPLHASVSNHLKLERHLYSRANFKLRRSAALAEWRQVCAA